MHATSGGTRKKVLIVSPQPFYEDRGTPIAVGQLAAALCSLDFDVDLLAYPIGTPVSFPGFRLLRGRRPFGIRSVRIGFSFRKILLDLAMLGRLRALVRSGQYEDTCTPSMRLLLEEREGESTTTRKQFPKT